MSRTEPAAQSRGLPQGGPYGPSPGVRSTLDEMTVRMQTVVEAAERAAQVIRHDAEEQARRHLADAQRKADEMTAERLRSISELTDDLISQAAAVRRGSTEMIGALQQAIDSVAARPTPAHRAEVSTIEEAVVYADRLAAAGYERGTIAGALLTYFGISDPNPILDRVMGRPAGLTSPPS